jgi:hypothetical protein
MAINGQVPIYMGKRQARKRVRTPCAVVNSARAPRQPTWKDDFRNRRTHSNDRSGRRSTVGGLGDKRRRTRQTGSAPRAHGGRRSTVRRYCVGSGRSVSVTNKDDQLGRKTATMWEPRSNQPVRRPMLCPLCGSKVIDTLAKTISVTALWRCRGCEETWTIASRAAAPVRLPSTIR